MPSEHQVRIVAARALRDRLRAEGRETDARIVDNLARSSASSAGLNKRLAEDLQYATKRNEEAKPC